MKRGRFARFAAFVLVYNLGIILWGAYVRASGSGAGCGSHWPLCNGDVIPRAPEVATLIEFAHRVSSGGAMLLIGVMLVWAYRAFGRRHPVRVGATLSAFFIVTEALVGAGLVLFSLVADNASLARALFMAVHLANTFLLLAALTLTAWWAYGGAALSLRGQGWAGWALLAGCVAVLILGVSGAVTALGDTLFPSRSLAEGLRADLSPTAHVLVRLRILHPAIATGVGLYLVVMSSFVRAARPSPDTRRFASALAALFVLQFVAGVVNVVLLAPIPMQLIHLLLADAVWIALVLLCAAALAVQPAAIAAADGAQALPAGQS